MPDLENIVVWKQSIKLVKKIYQLTESCEKLSKDYGLKQQIQRAAVSIPSNIAEWLERDSQKELHRFLMIARGGVWELKTQIYIIYELWRIDDIIFQEYFWLIVDIHKILNKFITTCKSNF